MLENALRKLFHKGLRTKCVDLGGVVGGHVSCVPCSKRCGFGAPMSDSLVDTPWNQ